MLSQAALAAYRRDGFIAATVAPRLTSVPVRLPLPPAEHQGSIYENQRATGRRFFATAAPQEGVAAAAE